MRKYLVGGSVRDQILGLSHQDKDWVVTGASEEDLRKRGLVEITGSFPVFIDPLTKDQYSLARTEKKSGHGYKGFTVISGPHVTLKQDLARRDFTMNAIAQDKAGNYYDFFGGLRDIANKNIRHISPSFAEDPLRVLRAARVYAKFYDLGFQIDPETLELMRQISNSQEEMCALSGERLLLEFTKAFATPRPDIFLDTLLQVGAFTHILQPLAATKKHTLSCIQAMKGASHISIFCALFLQHRASIVELFKDFRMSKRYCKIIKAVILLSTVQEKSSSEMLEDLKSQNMLKTNSCQADIMQSLSYFICPKIFQELEQTCAQIQALNPMVYKVEGQKWPVALAKVQEQRLFLLDQMLERIAAVKQYL